MTILLDLINRLAGKEKTLSNGSESARITGVGRDGIQLRSPSGNAGGQIAAKVGQNLGLNLGDVQNRDTSLNLKGLIEHKPDGRVRVDFRTLGGQLFEGSQAELSNLRGDALIATVGRQAFQNNAGGNFQSNVQTNIPTTLGTANIAQGRTTSRLSAGAISPDTNATAGLTASLKSLQGTPTDDGLGQLRSLYQSLGSDEEKAEFMQSLSDVFNSLDRTD